MKKEQKKDKFSLYPLNCISYQKLAIKSGHKDYKHKKIAELTGELFESEVCGPIDRHQGITETLWWDEGKNVLFPNNTNFLNQLLKSKFNLDDSAPLNLPHNTFILAMPKDFSVDGVSIPSVLVHYCKSNERVKRYDHATKLMGVSDQFEQDDDEFKNKDNLVYFYNDPYLEKGVTAQVNQSLETISASLQADSHVEYAKLLGELPKELVSFNPLEITETDKVIQYAITRIIASLSIYSSATNNKHLYSGLPKQGLLSIENLKKSLRYSNYTLGPTESKVSPNHHLRGFFFRNLKHEKYYNNEYKFIPKGSRWIFVDSTEVGDYDASTIKG
jgi:hypothetical protein